MIIVLALVVGVLYATGTYLLLQRTLTRIVMGLALMGHGVNVLLLLSGGRAASAPLIGLDGPFADPLPQAMALTAIVITFGIMSFLLALAYRSWSLTHDDEVEDDVEDTRIAQIHEIAEAERLEYEAREEATDSDAFPADDIDSLDVHDDDPRPRRIRGDDGEALS